MQRFKRPENTKEIKEQLEIVPVEEITDVLKLTGIIDEEEIEMQKIKTKKIKKLIMFFE